RSKAAMIVTEKPDEISDTLTEVFESGVTKLYARGGYSNEEKTVIYFVLNRFQISKMKAIVRSIDPNAFVTISEVADVIKSSDMS
ncbi:MAG: YitT family protein, partial [Clostridia bacterium]|nr:YitT family protein [Clostridia bacterium]